MTKKKILVLALSLAMVAILAVGGSLAYLTDTDNKTNTFTVGNVKIELLESSLHRENAGYANGTTADQLDPQNAELWSNVNKEGTGNTSKYKAGDTFYTDAQIEANAAEYKGENVQLIPGRSYHKMPYVKNVGNNDAYIRIRVMIPADLDTAVLNSSMYTTTALDKKEFTMVYDNSGKVDRDGRKYNVYTFTRIDPLAPGEMTYWNVWGTIHMDTTVTSAQSEELFGANGPYPNGVFPVLVEADAIQAEGFADAAAAWTAFDAQK